MLCLFLVCLIVITFNIVLKKKGIFKNINILYVSFILGLYIYVSVEFNDIFGNILCNKELHTTYIKSLNITGWQISHFLAFFAFGVSAPKYYIILYFSILWEVFEHIYGELSQNKLYWTSSGYNGQLKDIICNVLGFYLGRYVNKHFI